MSKSGRTTSRSRKRLGIFLLAAVIVAFGLLWLTANTWRSWLVTHLDSPAPADAIVLLGGLVSPRVEEAARLYHEGFAARVFVTGRGDAAEAKARLIQRGIPPAAIVVEDRSANTYQNAQFTVPLLREAGVRRALIVTSWFHSRRAYRCFEEAAPDISFRVVAPAKDPRRRRYEESLATTELWKLLFYLVRYQIAP